MAGSKVFGTVLETVLEYKLVTMNTKRIHEAKDEELRRHADLSAAALVAPPRPQLLDVPSEAFREPRAEFHDPGHEDDPLDLFLQNELPGNVSTDTSPTLYSSSLPPSPSGPTPDDDNSDFEPYDLFGSQAGDPFDGDEGAVADIDLPLDALVPQHGPIDLGHQDDPVRLVYLQAVIAQICGTATVEAATNQLQDGLDIIEACGVLPTHPRPMRSIVTAKKHLGLLAEDYIQKRPVCTKCYKYYSFEDIKKLDTPACTVPRCNGVIYRMKRERPDPKTGDERLKRYPAKILTYCCLIKAIQRFLLRSTFVKTFETPQAIWNAHRYPMITI
ncbi:hypothetical protein BV22DRAFT_1052746 [Leucogyrophana mollusca]|uniref:Uncharacterized protein n=1 Tax=Leucogyrophana mollusca TaxID=85980 RepID=A0ACB8AUH9_9AGAM|nr:hypothetical protein BV22DRAFT_1052746 [Leucogyrophana mollusca]